MTAAIAIGSEQVSATTNEGSDHPPVRELSPREAAHLLERTRREARRESIARHLAGDANPSNFGAMVEVMVGRDVFQGHAPCEACHGLGFRPLPDAVRAEYDDVEEPRVEAVKLLRQQIADAAPDKFDGGIEKKRLELKLLATEENQQKDRRARNRRSICRTCRGSGYGPRFLDGEPGKADSFFTTVTCPTCRGRDARRHPLLPTIHYGASTGGARMRGNTIERDPNDPEGVFTVVSDPRDDKAAERHDRCSTCELGQDGLGTGYMQPITCRPTLRTNQVEEEPNGVEDLPEFPAGDYVTLPLDLRDPSDFLEQAHRDDPLVAAAIAALHGRHGDTYSDHTWGRRFALFPLTDAGRQLADASRSETSQAGSYERALDLCEKERLAVTEATRPDPLRSSLIRMADDQARLLEARAERMIDEVFAAS